LGPGGGVLGDILQWLKLVVSARRDRWRDPGGTAFQCKITRWGWCAGWWV